jgi:hypothetical protein
MLNFAIAEQLLYEISIYATQQHSVIIKLQPRGRKSGHNQLLQLPHSNHSSPLPPLLPSVVLQICITQPAFPPSDRASTA